TILNMNKLEPLYIYTYGYRVEETGLCQLEMRMFFGKDTNGKILMSPVAVQPDRSPFMRERLEVMYEGENLEEILTQVKQIQLNEKTFKIIFVKTNDLAPEEEL